VVREKKQKNNEVINKNKNLPKMNEKSNGSEEMYTTINIKIDTNQQKKR
jgi:hypothetical protein